MQLDRKREHAQKKGFKIPRNDKKLQRMTTGNLEFFVLTPKIDCHYLKPMCSAVVDVDSFQAGRKSMGGHDAQTMLQNKVMMCTALQASCSPHECGQSFAQIPSTASRGVLRGRWMAQNVLAIVVDHGLLEFIWALEKSSTAEEPRPLPFHPLWRPLPRRPHPPPRVCPAT